MTKRKQSEIKSPLNYTGSKYRLLPQLRPLFPKKIYQFIDMCCGGCSVGINVKAEKHFYVDNNLYLIGMLNALKKVPYNQLVHHIENQYEAWKLTTKEGYLNFRDYFNKAVSIGGDTLKFVDLYVLLTCSYNHQLRFNYSGEFNVPYGNRKFNESMRINLREFKEALDGQLSRFINCDFDEFPYDIYKQDFIYIDPPYLLGTATYNEQGGWTKEDDIKLFNQLDKWHKQGFRWGLSNVLKHKGLENTQLQDWIKAHKNDYIVHKIEVDYSNSSSNKKSSNRSSKTKEVYITNVER